MVQRNHAIQRYLQREALDESRSLFTAIPEEIILAESLPFDFWIIRLCWKSNHKVSHLKVMVQSRSLDTAIPENKKYLVGPDSVCLVLIRKLVTAIPVLMNRADP